MKILLTGVNGQLGQQIASTCPEQVNLIKSSREILDLSSYNSCYEFVLEHKPDWIINSGAYTAVDKAENEKDLAYKVNSEAPKAFAKALNQTGGKLLQLSTDFVFGGEKSTFYKTLDNPSPINYYGFSKMCGEINALSHKGNVVLRTSWVYSKVGKNFLKTILMLNNKMVDSGKSLTIIADQVGCPTSTSSLAFVCWEIIKKCSKSEDYPSIMHWRNSGITSWYDFAMNITELAFEKKIIQKKATIMPISTEEYQTDASRPRFSVLDLKSTIDFLEIENLYWKSELEKEIELINKSNFTV